MDAAPQPRARYERVVERIRAYALRHGVGAKIPSVRTLIRTCGVSQGIVMRAIADLEAQGMLERRPRSGVYIANGVGSPGRLVLLEPNIFVSPSSFFEILLSGLVDEVGRDRLDIRFAQSLRIGGPLTERDLLPAEVWGGLRANQFGSVLLCGTSAALVEHLHRMGVPCVAFATNGPNRVVLGYLEACQVGVGELARAGCRRIALYNTPYWSLREVFLASLRSHGLSETSIQNRRTFREQGEPGKAIQRFRLVEHGLAAAIQGFGPDVPPLQRPDGILSMDDMFTQGLLMGLDRLGIEPGRDVEIATYANRGSPSLAAWEGKLIRMVFDPREIARAMHERADSLERGVAESPGWAPAEETERFGTENVYLLRPSVEVKSWSSELLPA